MLVYALVPLFTIPEATHRSGGGQLGEDGGYPTPGATYSRNFTTGSLSVSKASGSQVIEEFMLDGVARAIEASPYVDLGTAAPGFASLEPFTVRGRPAVAADPEADPPVAAVAAVADLLVDLIAGPDGALLSIRIGPTPTSGVVLSRAEAWSLAGFIRSQGIGARFVPPGSSA